MSKSTKIIITDQSTFTIPTDRFDLEKQLMIQEDRMRAITKRPDLCDDPEGEFRFAAEKHKAIMDELDHIKAIQRKAYLERKKRREAKAKRAQDKSLLSKAIQTLNKAVEPKANPFAGLAGLLK